MQSKKPKNENKQAHGYWEVYHKDGTFYFKVYFIENRPYGYCEIENYTPDKRYYCL